MKSSRNLSITAIFASCACVAAATFVATHAVAIPLDRSARVPARAVVATQPQRQSIGVLAILESVEGEKRQVSFRPTEISVNRSVKWQQSDPTKMRLAYNAREPALLQMEFTVTSATNVYADFISTFEHLTQESNDTKRPPLCRFMWGNNFPVFKGVIETLNVKYVRFAADGTPLWAVVKIQMKEAQTLLNVS